MEAIWDIMNPPVDSGDDVSRECFKEVVSTTSEAPDNVVGENTHAWPAPEFALLRGAVKRCEVAFVDFRHIVSAPSDASGVS